MKKSVIFVFVLLLLPLVFAKTIHPISKETINIEVQEVNIPKQERVIATDTYYYYGTGLIAKEENNQLEYVHKDNLGSTRVVTGSSGSVQEESTYLPYGSNLQNSDEKFTFTGKELDSTGLSYYGARYYDNSLGRFITVDPAKDGMNHYEYAASNPVRFVDPSGLTSENADSLKNYYSGEVLVTPERMVFPETGLMTIGEKEFYSQWDMAQTNLENQLGYPLQDALAEEFTESLVSTTNTIGYVAVWGGLIPLGTSAFVPMLAESSLIVNMPGKVGTISRWVLGGEKGYRISKGLRFADRIKNSGKSVIQQVLKRNIPFQEIKNAISGGGECVLRGGSKCFISYMKDSITYSGASQAGARTRQFLAVIVRGKNIVSVRPYNTKELFKFIRKEVEILLNSPIGKTGWN